MKAILLFCCLFLMNFNLNHYSMHGEIGIKRYGDGKLTWEDFQGAEANVGIERRTDALSALGISIYVAKCEKNAIHLEVFAYLNRSTSWVVKSEMSADLLNHEQRHFDIQEIGARMLRCKLKQLKITKENELNIFSIMNDLKTDIEQNYVNPTQDNYDLNTSHGIKTDNQNLWNKKIQKSLDSLEIFKDEKIDLIIE